ncbi:DUF554 domain-containing protein [Paenibacillus puerhi]|uniref:DUF554 domain-containing protein n=1 Tax=Paenibacillus puerhi TaxID=2692622 RepID=UPI001F30895B|nr:DUF554 domain-containing protein [Paenibacillus puerhi]
MILMPGGWVEIREGMCGIVILWGTIVNAAAIIAGSLIGLLIGRISESMKQTLMHGIGLALIVLGISMALKSEQFLLLVLSLAIGGLIGEAVRLERRLEQLGQGLERLVYAAVSRFTVRVKSSGGEGPGPVQGRLAAGFVNATLVYCIGAMAILGSLDSGLRGDHVILYTKGLMDGLLSVVFASTMGVRVLFSSLPILLYQGGIALGASWIASAMDQTLLDAMIVQLTAVGGILIIGVGINLLELRRLQVANLLPSLAVAAGLTVLWTEFGGLLP